jgi:DNA-binding MarR family transcriptional regulator
MTTIEPNRNEATGGVAFMITHAMRVALHARGLTDEEIAQVTPQRAHEILANPDSREVREFIETIVAQARAATKYLDDPGILQMVLVHPNTEGVGVIYRYAFDDPELGERMTREAVSASEAGHNVYVEARTVRRGLGAKQRGGLADTIAVFALVVDSDADKGAGWSPTVPVSLTVETSPGNHHCWLFFETALDPATGQALGERLRAATNADSDTGNVCQPYRVAGTANYPGKKKLERGRFVTPTRSLGFDPETLWTPERIEQEFPARKTNDGSGGRSGAAGTASESDIPADTLREIQSQDTGKRGTRFWNVMIVLKSLGYTIDGIVALFERYPDGIAAKYRGRLRHQVETVWTKLKIDEPKQPTDITVITVLSQTDFLAGFVPPDYVVDGVLQRRFVYSLTAVTGHGKTALALRLAHAVGSADPNARFGPHAVEKGRVVYFVGENPDDVRCRLIGTNAERSDDPNLDRIYYIVGVFDIAGLHEQLVAAIDKLGGVDLVLVDTSAAYFLKDDENSNPQMGAHARALRTLTTLPGGPCVLVLCHPVKHVTDPSQLLPRGGGAFMAEMDGNLTLWKHDENLITLHHSDKFRGPGFEPITFKLEKITTHKLVDRKGREIPTVYAVAISEQEEEAQEASAERDEDQLLAELAKNPKRSVADLARACGWLLINGEPHKSKVDRVLKRLQADKLVKRVRGKHWRLTPEAEKMLEEEEEEQQAEDRSGARGGMKAQPFHALRGMKQRPTVPCAYCGTTGEVYKFADGRLPKGQRHHADLHAGCAEPYFTGKRKPKPADGGSGPPESLLH